MSPFQCGQIKQARIEQLSLQAMLVILFDCLEVFLGAPPQRVIQLLILVLNLSWCILSRNKSLPAIARRYLGTP